MFVHEERTTCLLLLMKGACERGTHRCLAQHVYRLTGDG